MALTILYSTDAIRRYLLEQYGVAPQDLRDLGGSVRIGDCGLSPSPTPFR